MVSIRGPINSDSTNKFFQDIMKLDKEQEIIDSIVNLKKNGITYRKIADVIKNKFGRNLHYSFVYKLFSIFP